eukprot:TRINITY_DN23416_c0_g1_i1.p1 TRINITY_DN23416_c0_g1~~TRINITY_DN23416_c0_g1_i1.p1  ORF type:complete len:370 (+),score=43.70 TRINITY_DN23416_c0_g1_i1:66-1112(+)
MSMYRYSRGQSGSGQGSVPRPAWGSSGGHGRATSPEPGGGTATQAASGPAAGAGVDKSLSVGAGTETQSRHDEVMMQLENELLESRNACAWKDQRIAELSRTEAPSTRLKRDIRILVSELHVTRKKLSDTQQELQKARDGFRDTGEGLEPSGAASAAGGEAPSPTASGVREPGESLGVGRERVGSVDRSKEQFKISDLLEENRQLRERLVAYQAAHRPSGLSTPGGHLEGFESGQHHHHSRVPSGVGGRNSDAPPLPPQGYSSSGAPRPTYSGTGQNTPIPEEIVRPTVYSSAPWSEQFQTLGAVVIPNIGTYKGVREMAAMLQKRIDSSVLCVEKRHVPEPAPQDWD